MINISHLNKTFRLRSGDVCAARDVSLDIHEGEIYGVIGYSGAGKSTLVRCINLLETPDDGEMTINGATVVIRGGRVFLREGGAEKPASERQLNALRRGIGMIFQQFNLLDRSTVADNIAYPLRYTGMSRADIDARVRELLALVDLTDKADVYPSQLSGGQKQRVAIARALATSPKVLVCDEATSALDPKTTHAILELIRDINRQLGITVIVITHQMSVVQEICNRVAILEHGEVVEEGEVSEVFSNPRAEATRNLVYPDMADGVSLGEPGGQRVRIIFNGALAAKTPLLARMAMECGIAASILSASTRSVGDRAYGYMLLEIPGGPDELARAVNYLRQTPEVTVQVEVEYAAKEARA